MERRTSVLLLPGQGAQRERMAAGLYGVEEEFTASMDRFFDRLGGAGTGLRSAWLRPAPNPELDTAAVAQPLLLAVGHALGRAVDAGAGPPGLLLGHSVGELAAACLAGVFDPADVGALAAARSRALQDTGHGGMLAVAASVGDLPERLGPDVAVAAVNGPRQTVLAGPGEALAATELRLREAGFVVRAVRSGHAFHSPVMAEAARKFGTALAVLAPRAPRPGRTVVSSGTGTEVTAAQAADPYFWAGQLARTVRYWPALRELLDTRGREPGLLLLDASADRSLSAPARRHPAVRDGASEVVPLLAGGRDLGGPADATVFAGALRRLTGQRRGHTAVS
ncbi:acyltransferase domain-containing protein [Streptomyces sp. NBC_01511]|uniref:acyltransferase domain-containing protein n=1 Tax=unclassified Streptomyces TaxID=2593676 RepID=UPI003864CF06